MLEDVDLQELALLQLGSDYYNDAHSSRVAWGHGEELIHELHPEPKDRGIKEAEPMELPASDSWMSLFGNLSTQKNVGQGVRAVVLRRFDAKLGDQQHDTAWAQAIWSGERRLGAEWQLDPAVSKLTAGDYIEFDFEFLILPLSAESYFGPDAALKKRLAENPDNWPAVAHEVVHQKMLINGHEAGYPAILKAGCAEGEVLEIESAGTLNVLVITGLPDAGASWSFEELLEGESVPMGTRFEVEANPQVDFDPLTGTWSAVVCIQFEDSCRTRQFKLQLSDESSD